MGHKSRRTGKVDKESTPLYLLGVEVENIRCYGPAQYLRLSNKSGKRPAQWTLIFGDNGVGKTTLLQSVCGIASTLQDQKEVPSFIRYNWWPQRKENKPAKIGAQLLMKPKEIAEFSVNYPAHRRNFSPAPQWDFDRTGRLVYFGYGANRRHGQLADSGRKPLESSADESLFVDGADLLNAEEWFIQMSHFGPSRRQLKEAKAARKVREFLMDVLLDVKDIRVDPARDGAVEFKTPYGWVAMSELSVGFRTLIAWLVDFTRRMHITYPRSSNPMAQPAVVCIDEIDLHLHTRWQRNLLNLLTDLFPKTQFIATAHSTTIASAAPRGTNIVLLRRNKDHVQIHHDAAELLEGVR